MLFTRDAADAVEDDCAGAPAGHPFQYLASARAVEDGHGAGDVINHLMHDVQAVLCGVGVAGLPLALHILVVGAVAQCKERSGHCCGGLMLA